jgi:hypothetical protein
MKLVSSQLTVDSWQLAVGRGGAKSARPLSWQLTVGSWQLTVVISYWLLVIGYWLQITNNK